MMKKMLRSRVVPALVVLGLSSCDATPPANETASQPVPSEIVEPIPVVEVARDPAREALRETLYDIVRDDDPYARAVALGGLLATLGDEGVPVVAEMVEDMQIDLAGVELALLARYWASYDPEEASSWALRSSPLFRTGTVFATLTAWAEVDPQAAASVALGWVEQQPGLRAAVPIALINGWFKRDEPEVLAQFIHDLGPGFLRQRAIALYLRRMIQTQGIEAAKSWSRSLPDDDVPYKLAAFRQMASALPLFDQEAAMRWCDAECDGPYGKDLRGLISRRWAQRDGPAAMAWLSRAPEGRESDLAVRVTYYQWTRTHRKDALSWTEAELAAGPKPWHTPILYVYAPLRAGDDPSAAVAWAEQIEDDLDRENVLILVAREWALTDPEAALAWLLQSPLSEDARERARKPTGRKAPTVGG
jgi:hypothetical protein